MYGFKRASSHGFKRGSRSLTLTHTIQTKQHFDTAGLACYTFAASQLGPTGSLVSMAWLLFINRRSSYKNKALSGQAHKALSGALALTLTLMFSIVSLKGCGDLKFSQKRPTFGEIRGHHRILLLILILEMSWRCFCSREVGVLFLSKLVKTQSVFFVGENDLSCF